MSFTMRRRKRQAKRRMILKSARRDRPELCWPGGMHKGNTTAGFAHLHFLSHPEWMERLWR